MTQLSRGRRLGSVFSVRISDQERAFLELLQKKSGKGPRGLGPWLLWRALSGSPPPRGIAGARDDVGGTATSRRVILDLCGGSGSWSEPYRKAGYDVRIVDASRYIPGRAGNVARREPLDVRTFVPPKRVWGVLAAPPCTEFSIATNGRVGLGFGERDFVEGMACVNACMRIVLQCKPKWWALENPTGLLSRWLGVPADSWEPCDFGDPWTKKTSIWGDFQTPKRGPYVKPRGSAATRSTAAKRAITPPGFARAFFRANP